MGILNLYKQIEEAKKRDFQKRAPEFLKEYEELKKKHGCDWDTRLEPSPDMKALVAIKVLVDIKSKLEKEKDEQRKKTII